MRRTLVCKGEGGGGEGGWETFRFRRSSLKVER